MSIYKSSSLAMIPTAYKDGKLYSIKPVPEYGSELVTNGDFATDSDWALTQATISNGKLLLSTSDGSYTAASQTLGVIGKTYRVSLDVADIVGIISITIGGGTDFDITSNGTHSFEITSTTTTLEVKRKFGITNVSATIDNVSIKEVLSPSGDFTFSRGSNLAATRVDVNGLIEKGRENLLLQSNQFDTTWTTFNASVTSGQGGYDGTSDAWKFEATTTGQTYIQQSISIAANQPTALSIYAKKGNVDFLKFIFACSGSNSIVTFDLSDGSTSNDLRNISVNAEDVGGGWYRLSATAATGTNITQARFEIRSAVGSSSADAGSYIFVQDAQLEQGLVASDVIETGASTAQAGILEDMPRLDYSGGASCPSLLLEPQRTNILAYSEYFTDFSLAGGALTANDATSPEGFKNAYKFTEDSANSQHRLRKDFAVSAGNHTISVFVKGTSRYLSIYPQTASTAYAVFDLENETITKSGGANYVSSSIENYGNDWYRVILTCTTSASTLKVHFYLSNSGTLEAPTYVGDGISYLHFYGAQVEAGSYPTSYIPTYGSSVTRSKEGAQVTSVSDLIGQTQGTLFAEVDSFGVGEVANRILGVSNVTGAERIIMLTRSYGFRFILTNSSANNVDYTYSINTDGVHKLAMTYDANEVRIFVDGVKATTDSSVILPSSLNSVHIGKTEINGNYANNFGGSAKQALVFPTALTDSECIALTTL